MGETIFIFVLIVIAIILLVHKSGNIKHQISLLIKYAIKIKRMKSKISYRPK